MREGDSAAPKPKRAEGVGAKRQATMIFSKRGRRDSDLPTDTGVPKVPKAPPPPPPVPSAPPPPPPMPAAPADHHRLWSPHLPHCRHLRRLCRRSKAPRCPRPKRRRRAPRYPRSRTKRGGIWRGRRRRQEAKVDLDGGRRRCALLACVHGSSHRWLALLREQSGTRHRHRWRPQHRLLS